MMDTKQASNQLNFAREFFLSFKDLTFSEYDIAKLIGNENEDLDEYFQNILKQELELVTRQAKIKGIVRIVEVQDVNVKQGELKTNGITFHVGRKVAAYLGKSEYVLFFICTAGAFFDERISDQNKQGNFPEAYLVDLLGSVTVENAMDEMMKEWKEYFIEKNWKMTNRYSPGYCSWDVAEQIKLFSLFPEKFEEVQLSESCLMHPIKSVSGVIGLGTEVDFKRYSCDACGSSNCLYRGKK